MKTPFRFAAFTFIVALFALSGCVIIRDVEPVSTEYNIDKIYVVENPKVMMSGFVDELKTQIQELGFQADIVTSRDSVPPKSYSLEYTANWNWDFAEYLTYFNACLKYDGKTIGTITYDTHPGDMSFDKWGHTSDKLRPLLTKLLGNSIHSK